jgi:hypothetical protein
LIHGIRRWAILDQLHELVLVYDRPGRDREIVSDVEGCRVRHRDESAFEIRGEISEPLRDAVPFRFGGELDRLRITPREIRGRDRVEILSCVEQQLALFLRVELGVFDDLVQ